MKSQRSIPDLVVVSALTSLLLVVGILGVFISNSGSEEVGRVAATTTPVSPPTTGSRLVGDRPADSPDLAALNVKKLDFSEAVPGELAALPAGQAWQLSGNWNQDNGKANFAGGGIGRSAALLRLEKLPSIVQVTLPKPVENAGLVVLSKDTRRYVALVALPSRSQLWLIELNGASTEQRLLAAVSDIPLSGPTTIGIGVGTKSLEVIANGVVVATVGHVNDPAATSVGLTAVQAAEFDDLVIGTR